VEFHGNGSRLRCLSCDTVSTAAEHRGKLPPRCDCGRVLKPEVVFFGEPIPPQCLAQSAEMIEACEVMLVVGTSATVAPASLLPIAAHRRGALIAEFNLGPTELTVVCDQAIHANASESLPLLAERVKKRLAGAAS
jgi:NAD-dependent deacetylase